MVISDASGVVDGSTFERPIYAGNAIQTVKIETTPKKSSPSGPPASMRPVKVAQLTVQTISVGDHPGLSKWIEDKVAESDRPELTSAGVVVSGRSWRRL